MFGNLGKYIAAGVAAGNAALVGWGADALAGPVPIDYRVNPDYSNVHVLDGYDSVQISGASWTKPNPFGDVKDEFGNPLTKENRYLFSVPNPDGA